ncbi:FecR family protein [Magnetospirillum gryphiswaldense]|uniref:FecR protein domain-containing protein n=1 Tax=Magnetospirillum gryphiswaldense TaxID=55518 RepID=A4U2E6_9PROT|nr:FecR domain-containing protein [Magnetospirillum gryphiswaldense]AVM74111.1 FecR protein [Magnetospirillum gryphiswaldense MSR-1]AVM78014.1 FecR protein [Magnetospirillum gryphiswaldense]CAM77053.1 conserved hypothetical protein, secreted [Magnetospirillum gryphiswaldense MSR-1]
MVRFALVVALLLVGPAVTAAEIAGQVKTLEGSAKVVRDGVTLPLLAGADIHAADEIITADKSRLGLILRDDTTLSMGPSSRMVVERLEFEPAADKLEQGLAFTAGTFSVQVGQIAKLAPNRTDIRTPQMTIGIRGTSFLVKVDGND